VANSEVYMRFRLAPRSMTLGDLKLLFLTFGEFRVISQIPDCADGCCSLR